MGEAQRGFGSSAAAQAFKNKARLNTLEGTGKSWQSQENANAQILNTFNKDRQEAAIREAMINSDIDKYNAENVYGYDENRLRDLNAITGQMGNVAGQTFGNITANKNQLKQIEMLSKGNYKSVNRKLLTDLGIDPAVYEQVTGKKVPENAYGGMVKRSFRTGGTNNPGFKALPKEVQENIMAHMSMGGKLMYDNMYAEGGIHIKPSKVGSLHKHLGVPLGEKIPASKLADKPGDSPAIKKKKVFARNARKWNH